MDKVQSLSKAAKELMLKEPYYGFFLIMLNKLWDKKRVPTAGVSKNGINYQLKIIDLVYLNMSYYILHLDILLLSLSLQIKDLLM